MPQSVVWAREAYEWMACYGRRSDAKHSGGLRKELSQRLNADPVSTTKSSVNRVLSTRSDRYARKSF